MKTLSGLSLIEVLISTTILLLTVLFVVGTLTKALDGMQKSSDKSAGLMIAHSLLESKFQEILNDETQKDNFFSAPAGQWDTGTGALLDGTAFEYSIETENVTPVAGPLDDGNRLKKVSVVVWWWVDTPDTERVGMGRLRAEMVRLVNEASRK